MSSSADWLAAVGYRSDIHWTPEYQPSRDDYVKRLWDDIRVPGEDLTKPQVLARLGALHQILADLEDLVARACADQIEGPSSAGTGRGEWSFPVGSGFSSHPLGELRQPFDGCDEWGLHHRAYFGAPVSWPGALIWALLDFKPDSSINPKWREIQDASLATAGESVDRYIAATDDEVRGVRESVPPPL
ncbi:hypothetical protein SEA_WRIGLEY_48 [Gordonia phage Wrigley]|nr:hypothetical protein SEA_WRIGLEY_48 [Gordonia phage Wrigley]